MTHNFVEPGDCHIDRESLDGCALLIDENGDHLNSFDGSMSDAHVMQALQFANRLYSLGIKAGRSQKAAEIRGTLEIGDHQT